jgi:hypothetical protein
VPLIGLAAVRSKRRAPFPNFQALHANASEVETYTLSFGPIQLFPRQAQSLGLRPPSRPLLTSPACVGSGPFGAAHGCATVHARTDNSLKGWHSVMPEVLGPYSRDLWANDAQAGRRIIVNAADSQPGSVF